MYLGGMPNRGPVDGMEIGVNLRLSMLTFLLSRLRGGTGICLSQARASSRSVSSVLSLRHRSTPPCRRTVDRSNLDTAARGREGRALRSRDVAALGLERHNLLHSGDNDLADR